MLSSILECERIRKLLHLGERAPAGDGSVRSSGLQSALRHAKAAHVVVLVLLDRELLGRLFGKSALLQLDKDMDACLRQSLPEALRNDAQRATVLGLAPGELLAVWPDGSKGQAEGAEAAYSLKTLAQSAMRRRVFQWTGQRVRIGVAHELAALPESAPAERVLEYARKAQRMARQNPDLAGLNLRRDFREIVRTGQVGIAYQPIADTASGSVHGWEALSRGPASGRAASPLVLFDLAEELGEITALETLCRERALDSLGPLASNQKIFLNSHPLSLADPAYSPGPLLQALYARGVSPRNAVLEFGGGQNAADMDIFLRNLERCREIGLGLALGLGGVGDANLLTVAGVQPDYVKLDMALTRKVETCPSKRALVETLLDFAGRIRAEPVAEGVERESTARLLASMGVRLMQGFLFGAPDNPKPGLGASLRGLRPFQAEPTEAASCSRPVGHIMDPPRVVDPETEVGAVRELFEADETCNSLVAAEDGRPEGLVTRGLLHRQLSTKFGLDLFVNRAVRLIMDERPLMVEAATPVEQAAHQAMDRDSHLAFEDIVVTENGRLAGVVTVKKLMETLAAIQVEMAKGANPLTGLPGNITLEQELAGRIAAGRAFEIVYADLDNFKVYNDTYGFKNGDEIIKLCSQVLTHAVRRRGGPESMLCHVGGDDFVVITPAGTAEALCVSALRCFKRLVRNCYCVGDRERGWIEAVGRDGAKGRFPLVALSLAVLDVDGPCALKHLGERAARVKKQAKAVEGNCWVREGSLEGRPSLCDS